MEIPTVEIDEQEDVYCFQDLMSIDRFDQMREQAA
jgi:hypothetical protein